ncbi:MAG: hypothetical protein R6U98_19610 [Pirellulaceae bacterium]
MLELRTHNKTGQVGCYPGISGTKREVLLRAVKQCYRAMACLIVPLLIIGVHWQDAHGSRKFPSELSGDFSALDDGWESRGYFEACHHNGVDTLYARQTHPRRSPPVTFRPLSALPAPLDVRARALMGDRGSGAGETRLTVSGDVDGDQVEYAFGVKPGVDDVFSCRVIHERGTPRPSRDEGSYRVYPNTNRMNEEQLEKTVEEYGPMRPPDERWVEVRATVRNDRLTFFIDGRFVSAVKFKADTVDVQLELPDQAMLDALCVEPITISDRFMPVDLSSYYNTRVFGIEGDLDSGISFPEEARKALSQVEVDGVPFVIPEGNKRGDAVDLSGSRAGKGDMSRSSYNIHPTRINIPMPKRFYTTVYLLATSDGVPEHIPAMNVRQYLAGGGWNPPMFYYESAPTAVPRWNEEGAGSLMSLLTARDEIDDARIVWEGRMLKDGAQSRNRGRVFMVKADLEPSYFQEVFSYSGEGNFNYEFTKPMDLNVGATMARGPASAVRVIAATFEESRVEMVVLSDPVVAGNVFQTPEEPEFTVSLRNVGDRDLRMSLDIETRNFYEERLTTSRVISLPTGSFKKIVVHPPYEALGWHEVEFGLSGDGVALSRNTTFVQLPRDTRRAKGDNSPFGLWKWGSSEALANLMRRFGVRWYGPALGELDHVKHRAIYRPRDIRVAPTRGVTRETAAPKERLTNLPGEEAVRIDQKHHAEILMHLKPAGYQYGPMEGNLGRGTYAMPPEWAGERYMTCDPGLLRNVEDISDDVYGRMWESWREHFQRGLWMREYSPDLDFDFFAADPPYQAQYMRFRLPRQLIDTFGVDVPMFERMPERQPNQVEHSRVFYANEVRKEQGYGDVPTTAPEHMFICANPGSLTELEQANYVLRCHLLSFACGFERFCAVQNVVDAGGRYGRSFYGSTGLCYGRRGSYSTSGGWEAQPRMLAAAYATMTRILDGPSFREVMPTGSRSAFCISFDRKWDGPAHALWTVRGKRKAVLTLDGAGDTLILTDIMGNETIATPRDGQLTVTLGASPFFITGVDRISGIELGEPQHDRWKPRGEITVLDDFESMRWKERPGEYLHYQKNNFDSPRGRAKFELETVRDDEREGQVLSVKLKDLAEDSGPLTAQYTVLELPQPLILSRSAPEHPGALGIWVRGNSDWGRVIFELVDAEGEVWTHIGPKDVWNSNDMKSTSSIDFDGWRYIEVGLPSTTADGFHAAENAQWKHGTGLAEDEEGKGVRHKPQIANTDQWRKETGYMYPSETGEGKVDYPLALARIIIELRHNVVYGGIELQEVPEEERQIRLDRLIFTHVNQNMDKWNRESWMYPWQWTRWEGISPRDANPLTAPVH